MGRFAPEANPEYRLREGEAELSTLIATDVLAEGLNLQDCDLDLKRKLQNRIQEIHDTIGEDSVILDRTERLNEEAMYAIYEKQAEKLSLFENEEEEFVNLNEAEAILRQMRKDDPDEYERITNLRDGIRTARPSNQKGLYVFCQAGRYQQLFLVDERGEIVSRDIPRVLNTIKCGPDLKGVPLPEGYNTTVMRIKRLFTEEVQHHQAEREHTLSLTQGQRLKSTSWTKRFAGRLPRPSTES
ncbi:MAG: hypothetical protein ACE5JP_04950 [Candidatus Bipolaricaulia bacterium]